MVGRTRSCMAPGLSDNGLRACWAAIVGASIVVSQAGTKLVAVTARR